MLKIMVIYLAISLLAMIWAMNKKIVLVLIHVATIFLLLLVIHEYGQQKYMKGIYTATHLNYYPLEKSGK